MAVQSENQHDVVPLRSDKKTIASDAETASLNLCGNALVFAQGVHSAYTADVIIDAHSWNTLATRSEPDVRAMAKATPKQRDDRIVWG